MRIIKWFFKALTGLIIILLLFAVIGFTYWAGGHPIKAAKAIKDGKELATMLENSPYVRSGGYNEYGVITEINSDYIIVKKVTDNKTFKIPLLKDTIVMYEKELDAAHAPNSDTYKERRKLLKLGQYVGHQTQGDFLLILENVVPE